MSTAMQCNEHRTTNTGQHHSAGLRPSYSRPSRYFLLPPFWPPAPPPYLRAGKGMELTCVCTGCAQVAQRLRTGAYLSASVSAAWTCCLAAFHLGSTLTAHCWGSAGWRGSRDRPCLPDPGSSSCRPSIHEHAHEHTHGYAFVVLAGFMREAVSVMTGARKSQGLKLEHVPRLKSVLSRQRHG